MFNLLLEMGICLMHGFGNIPIRYTEWLGVFLGTHSFDQDVVQRKLKNTLENNNSFVRFKILMERN